MKPRHKDTVSICVLATPHFNLSATTTFLDPFRVANYLTGTTTFSWSLLSEAGGDLQSSSGLRIGTQMLAGWTGHQPDVVVVSSSWTPERYCSAQVLNTLSRWARGGSIVGGIDTGAVILARAGLLRGRSATVHYEHIDGLIEIAPDTRVTEQLFVVDGPVFTCCGGLAAGDLALHLLRRFSGVSVANATARYVFHHDVRDQSHSQNPKGAEPTGYATPSIVRKAIDLMEANLEDPLPIPQISAKLGLSQRQLSRLFGAYVQKSPVEYYRDIRLDRARGLVTQTEMKLSEVAAASGFNSQVHFSRAYKARFGLSPSRDRIQGRVPFEFRAWPMYSPTLSRGTSG